MTLFKTLESPNLVVCKQQNFKTSSLGFYPEYLEFSSTVFPTQGNLPGTPLRQGTEEVKDLQWTNETDTP